MGLIQNSMVQGAPQGPWQGWVCCSSCSSSVWRRWAWLVLTCLPSSFWPFMSWIARSLSSLLRNLTKPQPLDTMVSLSIITFADFTLENLSLKKSSSMLSVTVGSSSSTYTAYYGARTEDRPLSGITAQVSLTCFVPPGRVLLYRLFRVPAAAQWVANSRTASLLLGYSLSLLTLTDTSDSLSPISFRRARTPSSQMAGSSYRKQRYFESRIIIGNMIFAFVQSTFLTSSISLALLVPLADYALGFVPTTLSAQNQALLQRINKRDLLQPYAQVVVRVSSGAKPQSERISSKNLAFLRANLADQLADRRFATILAENCPESWGENVGVIQVRVTEEQRVTLLSTVRNLKSSDSQTSYIIYFFFIVFFGLAAVLTVCAIARHEYPRDSLLYAKFIAEVGR